MNRTFIFENAPKGLKSKAAFYTTDGKEMSVDLVDQAYIIPKDVKGMKLEGLIKELLYAGFVERPNHGEVYNEPERVPPKKEKKQVIYVLSHPDNSERPVKGKYEIEYDGKKEMMEIKNGVVRTHRKEIVDALIKREFNLVKEEDEKDNPAFWNKLFKKKGDK